MTRTLLLAFLLLLSLSSIAQNLPRLVSKIDSFNSGSVLGTRYDSTRFFYTGTRKDFDSTATKQLHKMIPVQFLSAGNYVLMLKSNSGTQSRIFTIR